MTIQNIQIQLLQLDRRLNERDCYPGLGMPVNMAMKEADLGIVRLEADDDVAVSIDEESVPAHGYFWGGGIGGRSEGWSFFWTGAGTLHDLDGVRVDMQGVGAAVGIDDCQLGDTAVLYYVGVGVHAID